MIKDKIYKVVKKNKSYSKRRLIIYDENDNKLAEVYPFRGWFAWNNNPGVDIIKECRNIVLQDLYWLLGEDCSENEWLEKIEKWDSGKGIECKTTKISQFFNDDDRNDAEVSYYKETM